MRITEGSEDPEWLHAEGTKGVSRGYRPGSHEAIAAQEEFAQDWLPGFMGYITAKPFETIYGLSKFAGEIVAAGGVPPSVEALLPAVPVDDTAWKRAQARKFLRNEALILGGICAAPVVYRLGMASSRGKRVKADDKVLSDLNDASNRIVALAASLGPAAVIPAAYITVEKLEQAEYIGGGLGDRVQTLIGLICAAPVAGAALSFLKPGK